MTAPREPRVLDDPDYRGIVSWVETARDASPEPLRVAFFRPRVLAWETGVRAMPLLSWPRVPEHVDEWCAMDIDYVILGSVGDRMAGRRQEWTAQAIERRPEAFELLYENSTFEAFRIRRDIACPAGNAEANPRRSGSTASAGSAGYRGAPQASRPDPPADSSSSTQR